MTPSSRTAVDYFFILVKFAFFAKKNQKHLKFHRLVTSATAVNAF